MNIVLWIVAGLLAVAFLASGTMKLAKTKEALAEGGMAWTEDFSAGAVKLIGASQVLGALGLVLPALFDVAVVLTPVAATCLALVMAGAVVVHLRRKEAFAPALVLGVLAALVAIGRFWIVPF